MSVRVWCIMCTAAGSTLVADPYYSAIPEVPQIVNTPSIYDVDDSAAAGKADRQLILSRQLYNILYCKAKGKGTVLPLMEVFHDHDTATECHLPHGITQCYLLPDTSEHTPP